MTMPGQSRRRSRTVGVKTAPIRQAITSRKRLLLSLYTSAAPYFGMPRALRRREDGFAYATAHRHRGHQYRGRKSVIRLPVTGTLRDMTLILKPSSCYTGCTPRHASRSGEMLLLRRVKDIMFPPGREEERDFSLGGVTLAPHHAGSPGQKATVRLINNSYCAFCFTSLRAGEREAYEKMRLRVAALAPASIIRLSLPRAAEIVNTDVRNT